MQSNSIPGKNPLPGLSMATNFLSCVLMLGEGFSGSSEVKNPPANVGDSCLIPGSGRSPGGGNGNPLQYSRLENPTDGEA